MNHENSHHKDDEPALLLREYEEFFSRQALPGPILDLACGDGRNGIFLAKKGLPVILCDASAEALDSARKRAEENGVAPVLWQVDLEKEGENPLPEDAYGGMLVFRYLHRPLMPCIRKSLKKNGLLLYETFTVSQARYGKPRNPAFLLRPGELREWFADWEILCYAEGIRPAPERAVAQLLCRKPIA